MNRAVFLDRDGVINRPIIRDGKPYPPADLTELDILPGVVDSLIRLKNAGYLLLVVSNQPDVARGITPRREVEAINEYLGKHLLIDRFIMCYHDTADGCDCRKPKPGMLLTGAEKFCVDLDESFMIGDRWRDISAGKSAGCRTFFIDYGYTEKQPESVDFRVNSLKQAVDIILGVDNE